MGEVGLFERLLHGEGEVVEWGFRFVENGWREKECLGSGFGS